MNTYHHVYGVPCTCPGGPGRLCEGVTDGPLLLEHRGNSSSGHDDGRGLPAKLTPVWSTIPHPRTLFDTWIHLKMHLSIEIEVKSKLTDY